MSVAKPQARDAAFAKPVEPERLDVSAQDRASSLVVALLVILGFVVLLMFLVWLSNRLKYNPPPVPVVMVEELGGGGSGSGTPGGEQNFEEVSPEEVRDLQEVDVTKTLEAVTDAVSTKAVDVESFEGGVSGLGAGEGTGQGDGRGVGPGGTGTATKLPDWEVRFNAATLDLYAQQLDAFRIELGAIGGGKKVVDYAARLSQPMPVARTGLGTDEKRRYLVWRKGPLAEADKSLLSKAGIDTTGRVVLQFIPPDVEQQMALLEAQKAMGKKLNEIRRTIFGVRATQGKYEFYVLEQEYR